MSTKNITCVICPSGCEMTAEYQNKKLLSVSGNDCGRGEKYASDEIQNPRRTLTSTVILNGSGIKLLPVRTDKPIEKEKLFEAMEIINKLKVYAPVKMGDVLFENFTENGVNLVAGRDAL